MGRHTESNNIMTLTVELKVGRVVTSIAIENKKTILTRGSRLSVLLKVLNPF
jgi:hypothetical protein